MSTVILYTDSSAIRAAVGVKEKEVSDGMLTDQKLEMQVRTDIYSWLPTYKAVYATGSAEAATDDEAYAKDLLTVYCLYFCAVRAIEMIMAFRQSVGDGKSEVTRFKTEFTELLSAFNARMSEAKTLLEEVVSPSSGGPALFGKATPDYDPVAGA